MVIRMSELDLLRLMDAVQVFERKINLALMYYGLRLPQYRVLETLDRAGKISITDLSRHFGVSRATTSVLVAKMHKAGLVTYLDNRADKRSSYLSLTELGQGRLKIARQAFELMQKSICETLPESVIDALNVFSQEIQHRRL